MKYLVFLFWVPAFVILHFTVRQEIRADRERAELRQKPGVAAHAGHPH